MEVADSWPRESDASVRPAGEGERPQRQRRGGGRWAALGQGSDTALPVFAHRGVSDKWRPLSSIAFPRPQVTGSAPKKDVAGRFYENVPVWGVCAPALPHDRASG